MVSSPPSKRLKLISAARWDKANGLFVIWLEGDEAAPAAVGLTKIAVQVILGLPFATLTQCAAAIETRRSAIEDQINLVAGKPDDARSAGIVFFTREELAAREANQRASRGKTR